MHTCSQTGTLPSQIKIIQLVYQPPNSPLNLGYHIAKSDIQRKKSILQDQWLLSFCVTIMNKRKLISSQINLFYFGVNLIVRKFRKFLYVLHQNITPSSTHTLTPGKLSEDCSPKFVYIFYMIGFQVFEDKSHSLKKSLLQKMCHFRPHLMILSRTFNITLLFLCPAIICKILHQKM